MVTVNWINLLDAFAKVILWVLLFVNLYNEKHDITLMYALILIAWNLSDIAINTRKNDE